MLYPYHDIKDELPLTAWGYLYNPDNPKAPIFWPPSMDYFKQFVKLIELTGQIGDFKKVTREVGGKLRTETFCKKYKLAKSKPQKEERSSPGE